MSLRNWLKSVEYLRVLGFWGAGNKYKSKWVSFEDSWEAADKIADLLKSDLIDKKSSESSLKKVSRFWVKRSEDDLLNKVSSNESVFEFLKALVKNNQVSAFCKLIQELVWALAISDIP